MLANAVVIRVTLNRIRAASKFAEATFERVEAFSTYIKQCQNVLRQQSNALRQVQLKARLVQIEIVLSITKYVE